MIAPIPHLAPVGRASRRGTRGVRAEHDLGGPYRDAGGHPYSPRRSSSI